MLLAPRSRAQLGSSSTVPATRHRGFGGLDGCGRSGSSSPPWSPQRGLRAVRPHVPSRREWGGRRIVSEEWSEPPRSLTPPRTRQVATSTSGGSTWNAPGGSTPRETSPGHLRSPRHGHGHRPNRQRLGDENDAWLDVLREVADREGREAASPLRAAGTSSNCEDSTEPRVATCCQPSDKDRVVCVGTDASCGFGSHVHPR